MRKASLALACAALWASAGAQFMTGFESPDYNGSPGGTALTGQQAWYNPVANSLDYNVYTYAGNAPMVALHPGAGGLQFVAGTSQSGASTFARAQRDQDFSAGTTWTVAYDLLSRPSGGPPAANNIGSFSLQPSTTNASLIVLSSWEDPTTAANWRVGYIVYTAGGAEAAQPGLFAAPEWRNLVNNQWYRFVTKVNFATNAVTEVSITDLTAGTTTTVSPAGWYLRGGSAGGLQRPTGFRFFTGGNNPVLIERPTSFTLFRGVLVSGDLASLGNSDDNRMVMRPGVVLNQAERPVQLIVEATMRFPPATALNLILESHCNIPNINQQVEMFDFVATNAYVIVDTRPAETTDTAIQIVPPDPQANFVQPVTNLMRTRISFKEAGPVFSYPWFARIDTFWWIYQTAGPVSNNVCAWDNVSAATP